MPTIILVEQRPPMGIRLLSRVSTYTHFFESVVAILVLWLYPALTPNMPALQVTPPSPRYLNRTVSIHSLQSTTSTLVDSLSISDEAPDESDHSKEVETRPRSWSKRSSTLIPPALSLVRRMSAPARRFSEHLSSTITSLQTSSPEISPDFYFGARKIVEVQVEVDVQETETEIEYSSDIGVVEEIVFASFAEVQTQQTTKRKTKLKKITKKAKSLLSIRRRF
ncbi:hypothetical protein Hypma_015910 [Hypsizygus marmoreus]|uniref:Uncharacterized protein n=1 Tax=Hypsizygus marmoreus TaxID=39966 RepID=A0A369K7I0_HYPMA|nr:hypothetical protein Hypma_015910 [Hypsizygus marmoreus]